MVAVTWGAKQYGSDYAPRHRAARSRTRPRALLAAVLVGLFLAIAVPAAADPVGSQAARLAAARPNPAPDLAHSLIYAGAGALMVSVLGGALIAYRRRQY